MMASPKHVVAVDVLACETVHLNHHLVVRQDSDPADLHFFCFSEVPALPHESQHLEYELARKS